VGTFLRHSVWISSIWNGRKINLNAEKHTGRQTIMLTHLAQEVGPPCPIGSAANVCHYFAHFAESSIGQRYRKVSAHNLYYRRLTSSVVSTAGRARLRCSVSHGTWWTSTARLRLEDRSTTWGTQLVMFEYIFVISLPHRARHAGCVIAIQRHTRTELT